MVKLGTAFWVKMALGCGAIDGYGAILVKRGVDLGRKRDSRAQRRGDT